MASRVAMTEDGRAGSRTQPRPTALTDRADDPSRALAQQRCRSAIDTNSTHAIDLAGTMRVKLAVALRSLSTYRHTQPDPRTAASAPITHSRPARSAALSSDTKAHAAGVRIESHRYSFIHSCHHLALLHSTTTPLCAVRASLWRISAQSSAFLSQPAAAAGACVCSHGAVSPRQACRRDAPAIYREGKGVSATARAQDADQWPARNGRPTVHAAARTLMGLRVERSDRRALKRIHSG